MFVTFFSRTFSGILETVLPRNHPPLGRDRVHAGRGASAPGIPGAAEERRREDDELRHADG